MSGISTGTGIFSGIDTTSLINQLLAIDAQPAQLAQQRVLQLQGLQASYLDLNASIAALKSAAGAFHLNNIFQSNKATSSSPDVLSATASNAAAPGSYTFIVDRLVSTQQLISRGFADANTTGINAGTFSVEPAAARLDRDTSLADLNGGAGISRGKIVISDDAGHSATVDLTRAATADDVLDAINGAGVDVTASVKDDHFVISSNNGAHLTIANAFGYNTATDLGIATTSASATVTGSAVYTLGAETALGSLNDGNGVFENTGSGSGRYDFTVKVTDGSGTTNVNVNIGAIYDTQNNVTSAAPTTLGGVIDRINQALQSQFGNDHIKAAIGSDGASLSLTDADGRSLQVVENSVSGSTTAHDLGLTTSAAQTGTLNGSRILAGLNSTLARNLNGGSGITGDGHLAVTGRDGSTFDITLDPNSSIDGVLSAIATQSAGKITGAINRNGTGIVLTDHTGGTGNFIVQGTTAQSLGVQTSVTGVAASTVDSGNLQRQYMTIGTQLSSLRNGQGVGTGSFRITDSTGVSKLVTIDDNDKTLNDVIKKINTAGSRVQARINDHGDGILLYEDSSGGGSLKITAADVSGGVGSALNLVGTAAGTGTQNTIDGSFERKITFAAGDTLQTVASKITAAGVGVNASVISDGGGSTPYRLTLTAKGSGSAGRFVIDTGGLDLGLSQLDAGQDARVFFGSTDPARGLLLTSSTNTMNQVIGGVTVDLNSVGTQPVTLSVSRDTSTIETAIGTFVSSFNTLVDKITSKTGYDPTSDTKGPLLGDATTLQIQSGLYRVVEGTATGVSSRFTRLSDVGITVGTGGDLQFDQTKFEQALSTDYQGVADLVGGLVQSQAGSTNLGNGITVNDPDAPPVYTKLGVASGMENLCDSFINSVSGLLTRQNQTLQSQIDLQNQQISDLNDILARKKQVYQSQFLAMEEAIGSLQQQQQALSGIHG